MVTGVIDLLISEKIGSATVAKWSDEREELVLECIFLMTPVAPKEFELDRYLPPTLLRVVISAGGDNVSKKYDYQSLNASTREPKLEEKESVATLPKEAIKGLIQKALNIANKKSEILKKKAVEELTIDIESEKQRLMKLKQRGAVITEDDLEFLSDKFSQSKILIADSSLALDALRLVF